MTHLLIAGSGGHLRQLHDLASRLPSRDDRLWVTDPTPQSEVLLRDEQVIFLPHHGARAGTTVLRNTARFMRNIRGASLSAAYSTGAGIAVSTLPYLSLRGVPCVYLESATRVTGPSMSGRILQATPGVRTYTQYRHWNRRSWAYAGSVFDAYTVSRVSRSISVDTLRVVVTLGANQELGFRRLIDRVLKILPPSASVTWQVGPTRLDGLGIVAHRTLSPDILSSEIRNADIVIAHAGTGSALVALDNGKVPILIPRSADRDEHIDNHQHQLARYLSESGLAIARSVDALTLDDLCLASGFEAVKRPKPPPLLVSIS